MLYQFFPYKSEDLLTLKFTTSQLQPGSPALAQRSQPINSTNLESPGEQLITTDELTPDAFAITRLVKCFLFLALSFIS